MQLMVILPTAVWEIKWGSGLGVGGDVDNRLICVVRLSVINASVDSDVNTTDRSKNDKYVYLITMNYTVDI